MNFLQFQLHVFQMQDYIILFLQNDMTRVALRWEEMLMPLLQKYKLNITWGDQDLLNIIFHHNPGLCNHTHSTVSAISVISTYKASQNIISVLAVYHRKNISGLSTAVYWVEPVRQTNRVFCYVIESLYVFPCQWNYRPDHCIYGSNCQEAEHEGVFILHGNRGVYHDDKQPAFRAVYEAIQKVATTSEQ